MEYDRNLIYEINMQVLKTIRYSSKKDIVRASVVFGIPAEVLSALSGISTRRLEQLADSPVCFLTLRNCGDSEYWLQLVENTRRDSEAHRLNLEGLIMSRGVQNILPVQQRTVNDSPGESYRNKGEEHAKENGHEKSTQSDRSQADQHHRRVFEKNVDC